MKEAPKKKRKLRNIALFMSLPCYAVLVALFAVAMLRAREDATAAYRRQVDTIADSAQHSLALIDGSITAAAERLSVFGPIVSVCEGGTGAGYDSLMRAYDAVSFTVGYLENVRDICAVRSDGEIVNFFTGYANEYLEKMPGGVYDLSGSGLKDEAYWFPGWKSKFGDLFLYFCPVVRIDPQRGGSERVGTLVLSCETETMTSLLSSISPEGEYACAILNADGSAAARAGSFSGGRDGAYTVTRDAGKLRLEISVPKGGIGRGDGIVSALGVLSAAALFLALSQLYYSWVIKRNLTDPVRRLVSALPAVTLRDNPQALPRSGVEEIDIITGNIDTLVKQLAVASRDAVRKEHEVIEAELRKNEAELYALQSQINPHFLFNTLQCVRSLAIIGDTASVGVVCSALSAILRYSLSEKRIVSLREEAAITEKYLDICRIRYRGRHTYRMDIPPALEGYSCPRLILQPLVENAIQHGLSLVEGGGEIRIAGRVGGGTLALEVADNGAPMAPERLERIKGALGGYAQGREEGSGKSFGLLNIHRRVQLEYGDIYGLEIACEGGWKRFTVHLPPVPFERAEG